VTVCRTELWFTVGSEPWVMTGLIFFTCPEVHKSANRFDQGLNLSLLSVCSVSPQYHHKFGQQYISLKMVLFLKLLCVHISYVRTLFPPHEVLLRLVLSYTLTSTTNTEHRPFCEAVTSEIHLSWNPRVQLCVQKDSPYFILNDTNPIHTFNTYY
jgi:hypothetical protein